MRIVAVVVAVVVGTFMSFDGLHRLITGSFIGGTLGPWSLLVRGAGFDPLSPAMGIAFVVFGIAWLAAAAAIARGRARIAVAVLAVATLWYLPLGTAFAAVVLLQILLSRRTAAHS